MADCIAHPYCMWMIKSKYISMNCKSSRQRRQLRGRQLSCINRSSLQSTMMNSFTAQIWGSHRLKVRLGFAYVEWEHNAIFEAVTSNHALYPQCTEGILLLLLPSLIISCCKPSWKSQHSYSIIELGWVCKEGSVSYFHKLLNGKVMGKRKLATGAWRGLLFCQDMWRYYRGREPR